MNPGCISVMTLSFGSQLIWFITVVFVLTNTCNIDLGQ